MVSAGAANAWVRGRMRDRSVVDYATVDECPTVDRDGREHARDRRAGADRVGRVAATEQMVRAAPDVGGDHVERDERVLEALEPKLALEQTAEPRIGEQVVRLAEKSAEATDEASREHVGPP